MPDFAPSNIIIGLGNPGEKYTQTAHNLGWWVIDQLVADESIRVISKEAVSHCELVLLSTISGKHIVLAKPNTYVNLTGNAAKSLLLHFQLPSSKLIVISDDINLDVGQIRIRQHGGSGNHNGLKSIIDGLGSEHFTRVRIGIGTPSTATHWSKYVLTPLSGDRKKRLERASTDASEAVKRIIIHGVEDAMNNYNGAQPQI